ncbi:hypothetical protein M441DRAFT_417881 [Trichoderma asperellum CBS 433.97]|uniref:Uncharacterized protein n=1 Tax=Trichoderma asperellum (strain ATCC 204424 / CBS 433.97 / NBRC 101777) TaxID=1042311 RepID=A0A2T3Z8H8_TRIA4|nr:hypothetical protein M441DRAFT_417881 [Trichoderma asperellum CBS 433.97]PTB41096.1 hypothetical protein M441DRAFT_417881 [Trichoderma asperellum CBS 433.97]
MDRCLINSGLHTSKKPVRSTSSQIDPVKPEDRHTLASQSQSIHQKVISFKKLEATVTVLACSYYIRIILDDIFRRHYPSIIIVRHRTNDSSSISKFIIPFTRQPPPGIYPIIWQSYNIKTRSTPLIASLVSTVVIRSIRRRRKRPSSRTNVKWEVKKKK